MHSLLSRPHSHEEDACSHYHRSAKDDQYEIAHTGNLPPSSEVVGSAGGNASRQWRYRCSDSPKPFYDTLGDLTPKLVSLASRVQP